MPHLPITAIPSEGIGRREDLEATEFGQESPTAVYRTRAIDVELRFRSAVVKRGSMVSLAFVVLSFIGLVTVGFIRPKGSPGSTGEGAEEANQS